MPLKTVELMRFNRERYAFIASSYLLSLTGKKAEKLYQEYVEKYGLSTPQDHVYSAILIIQMEEEGLNPDINSLLRSIGKSGRSTLYKTVKTMKTINLKRKTTK